MILDKNIIINKEWYLNKISRNEDIIIFYNCYLNNKINIAFNKRTTHRINNKNPIDFISTKYFNVIDFINNFNIEKNSKNIIIIKYKRNEEGFIIYSKYKLRPAFFLRKNDNEIILNEIRKFKLNKLKHE